MTKYGADIRRKMEELPTEELEEIWRERDYSEYTQEAFDAVYDILVGRGKIKVRETKTGNQQPEYEKHWKASFFSFESMVAPSIMKAIYLLGVIGSFVYAVFVIYQGIKEEEVLMAILALPAFGIANIIWRLVFEVAILGFRIHEVLVSIDRKLSNDG